MIVWYNDCLKYYYYYFVQLLLCKGVRPPLPLNKCHGYDTKQSDGEVPVMLELWRMQSILSLSLLSGATTPGLCPGVVGTDRVLSLGQIELNCVLKLN